MALTMLFTLMAPAFTFALDDGETPDQTPASDAAGDTTEQPPATDPNENGDGDQGTGDATRGGGDQLPSNDGEGGDDQLPSNANQGGNDADKGEGDANNTRGDEGSEGTFAVTVAEDIEHGTVKPSTAEAKAGDTVELTVTPDKGYDIYEVKVDGVEIEPEDAEHGKYTFTMPAKDVTVSASFDPQIYNITVNLPTNGTIGTDPTTEAACGSQVRLTITPEEGYALKSLKVVDGDNVEVAVENDSFTMPASNVTVTATFAKVITVSFYNGPDATEAWTVDVFEGETIPAANRPDDPTPDSTDIQFGGWYAASNPGVLVELSTYTFTEATTLIAQWNPVTTYVAQIGETRYETLQAALTAAREAAAGGWNTTAVTVNIIEDITFQSGETWTPVVYDQLNPITINGNNHTITGLPGMLYAKSGSGVSTLTINDLTFDHATVNVNGDYAAVIMGYADCVEGLTFNNVHIQNATVTSSNYAGAFVGYAAGYSNENDGALYQRISFNNCSVTGSTITGGGSAGGLIGHAGGSTYAKITVTGTTVTNNTVKSTGSSNNKAGALFGTVGALAPTANHPDGGLYVSATVSQNTVTSNSTTISTIYGRQGTSTGVLTLTAGGSYDSYPIEQDKPYAQCVEGYILKANDQGAYSVVPIPKVAKIGDVGYTSLQAALDAAHGKTGNVTVTLIADITEVVVIHQKAGLNLTVDGGNHMITGQIHVDGNGRDTGTETLTIQNMQFAYDAATFEGGFVNLPNTKNTGKVYTTGGWNYAHNITVSDCSFTGAYGTTTAFNFGSIGGGIKNITLKNLTADSMHSLTQMTGVNNVTIEGCKLTNSKNGISLTSATGTVTVKDNEVNACETADGYTFRMKGSSSATATLSGNTFSGFEGLVLNTSTGKVIITDGHYAGQITDAAGEYEISGGYFTVIPDLGYCAEGLYPIASGNAEYPYTVGAAIALVDGLGYATFAEAVTAANGEKSIKLLANIAEEYTLKAGETLKVEHNGKTLTVKAPENYTLKTTVEDDVTTYTIEGLPAQVIYMTTDGNATTVLQRFTDVKVGDPTPAFTGTLPMRVGYTLNENDLWVPAVTATVEDTLVIYSLKWLKQHTVTFNADNGSTATTVTVNDGELVAKPTPDPEKTGHEFLGWFDGNNAFDFDTKRIYEDITLKANWQINQYTVTFKDGDEILAEFKQDYGTSITAPEPPAKEGQFFTGWSVTVPETIPAENLTIYAQYMLAAAYLTNGTDLKYYKTVVEALEDANNMTGDLTLMILRDSTDLVESEVDVELSNNLTIDSNVEGGVTVSLGNNSKRVNLFAAGGKDLTITDKVNISYVGQIGSYEGNNVTLNGDVNAFQFYMYRGTLNVTPSANITFYGDGQWGMWGDSSINVLGALEDALSADVSAITPQVSGGYPKYFWGNDTISLKDTYVRTTWITGDSRYTTPVHTLSLDNSILVITGNRLTLSPATGHYTITGSRIIANNGTVSLNENDVFAMDWKSSVTAKIFSNAGTIKVDMAGATEADLGRELIIATEPFELGHVEYVNNNGFVLIINEQGNAAIGKAVAKIEREGETLYFATIQEAVTAANENEVIEVIAAGDYTLPGLPKKVTLEGAVDGVVFNHTTEGNIAAIPNGATFENVAFNFGNVNYHGFQHAGAINMIGCTLNGKFFSYGDMNFTDCAFVQTNNDYHMWCYSGNVTYDTCTFTNGVTGKFLHVYNESSQGTKVVVKDCTFINNSGTASKAAVNIKETCRDNGNVLAFDVEITGTNTLEGPFPAASESASLVVGANGLWQVDHRLTNGAEPGITVYLDDVLVYPVYKASVSDGTNVTNYTSLKNAITAANQLSGEVTVTMLADDTVAVEGYALTINAGKNIVLDLNGYEVIGQCTSSETSALIRNLGTLTIKDSGENGKLIGGADPTWTWDGSDDYSGSYASNLIRNEGTLVVDGGYLYNASSGSAAYAIDNYGSGKVTINGGTLDTGLAYSIRMFCCNGGSVTVNDGVISQGLQVMRGDNADLIINGGVFNDLVNAYGQGDSTVVIKGGTFNDAVIVYYSPVTVTGGEFKGTNSTYGSAYFVYTDSVNISEADETKPVFASTVSFYPSHPESAQIAICGGEFSGDIEDWSTIRGYISGGIFGVEPDPEDIVPGKCAVKDGDWWVIGNAAAQIGNVGYVTLASAIEAAQNGETVKLLADIALTETQPISKNLTLDLNGHNITADGARALWVKSGDVTITGEGTISASGAIDASSSVIRVGDSAANANKAKLTVGKDVTVSSDKCYGITVFGLNDTDNDKTTSDIELVMNGTVSVTGTASAISGNGTTTLSATTMTINGTVEATDDYAIYHPGKGTLTVNGTVEGKGGIEAKGGIVNIVGGLVKATAEEQSHTPYNNGASTKGYAVAAVNNTDYAGQPIVTITGGTVIGKAIILADGEAEHNAVVKSVNQIATDDDYKWVDSGDPAAPYMLVEKVYVAAIGEAKYETLEAAAAAANAGDTIVLLKDAEIQMTISLKSNVTLDGAGHTVSGGGSAFKPGLSDGGARQLIIVPEGVTGAKIENVTLTSYSNQWGQHVVVSHLISISGSGTVKDVTFNQYSTRNKGADAINTNGAVTFEGTLTFNMGAGIWSPISLNANNDRNVVTFAEGASIVIDDDQRTKPQAAVRTHGWVDTNGNTRVIGAENIGYVPVYGKAVGTYSELSGFESATGGKVGNATGVGTLYNFKANGNYFVTFALAAAEAIASETNIVEKFADPAAEDTYTLPAGKTLTVIGDCTNVTVLPEAGYAADSIQAITADGKTVYSYKTMVAEVNSVQYPTLAGAVEAAAAGDTVTLLADIALTETQTISKDLTLDLNGHNITADGARALWVKSGDVTITGEGTISASGAIDASSSVIRVGDSAANANKAKLTVGKDVTVSSDKCYGITVFGLNDTDNDKTTSDIELVMNGTVSVTGTASAISGNGTTTLSATTMTINGTVEATDDYAIYHPGKGTLTVNGTVEGKGGIEAKGGAITINAGATVKATATEQSHSAYNNGASTSGYAVAAVSNPNYSGEPTVTILGATIDGKAIILADFEAENVGVVKATVNTIATDDGYDWNERAEGEYYLEKVYELTIVLKTDTDDDYPVKVDGVSADEDRLEYVYFKGDTIEWPALTRDGYPSYTKMVSSGDGLVEFTETTMPGSDLTVFIKWTGDTKLIVFADGLGGILAHMDVAFGVAMPVITYDEVKDSIPERAGYRLDPDNLWTPMPGTGNYQYVRKDTTFNLNWIEVHTVTFDADGGLPVPAAQPVDHNARAQVPAEPTLAGHTFLGWFDEQDGKYVDVTGSPEGTSDGYFDRAVTADLALKAKWQIKQYTVTFVDEDGTTVLKEAALYDYGTLAADIAKPADPTKAADANGVYTFAGWDPEIADVTADATYTATYTTATTVAAVMDGEEVIGYYATLQEAVDAGEGKTVKVLADIDLAGQVEITKSLTLDLNGKTINHTGADIWDTEDGSAWSLISVQGSGVEVTVTGNGTLQAKENDTYAMDLRDGAKLTVENGSFIGNIHAIYVLEGELTVNGGYYEVKQTYSVAQPYDFTLNCWDTNYTNGTAKITVNGGTFYKFDPQASNSEPGGILDETGAGYVAIKEGDTYVVQPGANITFKNGEEVLQTIRVAKDGTVVYEGDDPTKAADADGVYTFAGWAETADDEALASLPAAGTTDVTYYAVYNTATTVAAVMDGEEVIGYYATLQEAVDAGEGETVTLLVDLAGANALTERVNVNASGKAITIDLNGKTIAVTHTSGNGSAFNIVSGTVTIKNGTIDGTGVNEVAGKTSATQVGVDDGICLVTVRSGATLNLEGDDLHMIVNSKNGSCVYPFAGGTVNISGGTYENKTTETYQYKEGFQGLTVNQANVESQLVNITGGTFYGNDPQLGDDSNGARFVEAGYVAMPAEGTTAGENGTYTVVPGGVITFVNDDGTELQTNRLAKDATPEYTGATPTKAATAEFTYTFAGWTPEVVAVTGDATYTANYTATPLFTVTFDANGGTFPDDETTKNVVVASGTAIPADERPTAPTREGYTFQGWYETDEEGNLVETEFDFETPITGSITLKAQWKVLLPIRFASSISPDTQIALNSYIGQLPDDAVLSEYTAKVFYNDEEISSVSFDTLSGYRFTVDGITSTYYYLKIVELAAKMMTDEYVVKVFCNDVEVAEQSYSIRTYCEARINNDAASAANKALCRATLTYGAEAQKYFQYKTDDLADKNIARVDLVEIPSEYAISGDPTLAGISAVGTSGSFESQVFLNLYFVPEQGYTKDDFTFIVKKGGTTYAVEASNYGSGWIYLRMPSVAAKDLGTAFEITVTNNRTGATATWNRSAMNYAHISQQKSPNMVDLVRAIYQYYLAAK